jgi:restriction system protein
LARQSRSVFDKLVTYPWWFNVILAIVVYFSFKYWIPSITFQEPFYKGMAMTAKIAAPAVTGLLFFVAVLSAFNSLRKGGLLDRQKGMGTLRTISWQKFEVLVGETYRRKSYTVSESGGGGADGGVDLILRKNGEKLLVQCKHWKMAKVGVKVVRELYGVVAAEGATGGVVISSGTFTQESRDFARGKPIELVDGSELIKLIADVQKIPLSVNNKPKDNACPLCESEMALRTAKKGPNAGGKFWGCTTFPKCRGTMPFSA